MTPAVPVADATACDALTPASGEALFFSVTPPRLTTPTERVREIAATTLGRLEGLPVDGLILYDIDDESDRNSTERPFPFQATLDPADYLREYLSEWGGPSIVYRCVGKYAEEQLSGWMRRQNSGVAAVFVGASSAQKQVHTSLKRAYEMHREVRPGLPLGGVAIPERHTRRTDEHSRLLRKQQAGCSFFVSQVVYDVRAAKDMVSDYAYGCRAQGVTPVPIMFTLSMCGSTTTLEFLEWLGVDVPRWVRNDLLHASDPLEASRSHSLHAARELAAFCRHVGVPFGFNVDSVSIRREEIEATVALAHDVRELLASRHLPPV